MKKRGFGANKFNGNYIAIIHNKQYIHTQVKGFGGKVELGETIEEGARRELFVSCKYFFISCYSFINIGRSRH